MIGSSCRWLQECIPLDKSVLFPEFVKEKDHLFIYVNHMKESLKDEAQVFAMFASLQVESKAVLIDLHVVCEFPNVFPDYIVDLSPREKLSSS